MRDFSPNYNSPNIIPRNCITSFLLWRTFRYCCQVLLFFGLNVAFNTTLLIFTLIPIILYLLHTLFYFLCFFILFHWPWLVVVSCSLNRFILLSCQWLGRHLCTCKTILHLHIDTCAHINIETVTQNHLHTFTFFCFFFCNKIKEIHILSLTALCFDDFL